MTTVARFEIDSTRFLDPHGKPMQVLPPFARDPAAVIPLYRAMVQTRVFACPKLA